MGGQGGLEQRSEGVLQVIDVVIQSLDLRVQIGGVHGDLRRCREVKVKDAGASLTRNAPEPEKSGGEGGEAAAVTFR